MIFIQYIAGKTTVFFQKKIKRMEILSKFFFACGAFIHRRIRKKTTRIVSVWRLVKFTNAENTLNKLL